MRGRYCGLFGTSCPGAFSESDTHQCGHCILAWLPGGPVGADKSWRSIQCHLKVLAHYYGGVKR